MENKIRKLTALCIALAVLTAGCAAWGIFGTVSNNQLKSRIEELEIAQIAAEAGEHAPVDAEAVAARFNGGVVTAGEAANAYYEFTDFLMSLGIEDVEEAGASKEETLRQLVEEKILVLKAQEYGVYELTDERRKSLEAEADDEFEAMIEEYAAYRTSPDKTAETVHEETATYLEENGITRETILSDKLANAWRNDLKNRVINERSYSDDDLKDFYEKRAAADEALYTASFEEYEYDADYGKTMLWNPEGVRKVDTILIAFDDDTLMTYFGLQEELAGGNTDGLERIEELYAPVEAEAGKVAERLNAGESFETLQAQYGSMDNCCTFVGQDSCIYGDAFRDAALSIENIGGVSDLVRTDAGVCILRYAGDVPAGRVPFETVRDGLSGEFRAEMESEIYNQTVEKWLADADIELFPETF